VLRKNAKIELIRSVPLFANCKKRELTRIAAAADIVEVPAGQPLVREGERLAREFMVIVDGEVEVRRRGRRVATLGPGGFFGEMALLARGPRRATVTTTAPSQLLVVTSGAFHDLLDSVPSLQMRVLRALAERLEATAL